MTPAPTSAAYKVVGGPPPNIDGITIGFGESFPGDAVEEDYLQALLDNGQVVRTAPLEGAPLVAAPEDDPAADAAGASVPEPTTTEMDN